MVNLIILRRRYYRQQGIVALVYGLTSVRRRHSAGWILQAAQNSIWRSSINTSPQSAGRAAVVNAITNLYYPPVGTLSPAGAKNGLASYTKGGTLKGGVFAMRVSFRAPDA